MNALHPLWWRFLGLGAVLAESDPERFTHWVELFETFGDPDVATDDPLLALTLDALQCSPSSEAEEDER